MKLKVLDTAGVVVAKEHNPTILHPSFLISQGIVPSDWEWEEESVVSTPAFSAVKFKNGIQFTVESEGWSRKQVESSLKDGTLLKCGAPVFPDAIE